MKIRNIIIFIFILTLAIFLYREYFCLSLPSPLEWNNKTDDRELVHTMNEPDDPEMKYLRLKYSLDNLISKSNSEYETLKNIVKWTHNQWSHNGYQNPSRPDPLTILKEVSEGKNFKCTEYAIIVAACARSLNLPSRVLYLKRHDVETAESNAGHVVAEVWIKDFQKWVMADAQFDAIPELDGIPLNAVEFQKNFSQYGSGLRIHSSSINTKLTYIDWIDPYLFYFQVAPDQRFYHELFEESKETYMLVPRGAKKPTTYQRNDSIENCTYISNPNTFYPQM